MFRLQDNVPEVYVNESRDFQLLCRLFDLVIQSSRYSINSMSSITDTMHCNSKLLPLLQTKIGLFKLSDCDDKALRMILNAYPHIVRYKGTVQGLIYIINLIQHLSQNVNITYTLDEYTLRVQLDNTTEYLNIFKELVTAVKPTGFTIDFVINEQLSLDTDEYNLEDTLSYKRYKEYDESTERGVVSAGSIQGGAVQGASVGFTQVYNSNANQEDS